jgi:hypothetical protein
VLTILKELFFFINNHFVVTNIAFCNLYINKLSNCLKKIVAIIILISAFTSQVGYYFIYSFQQWQLKAAIKKELFSALPDSSLEIIIAEEHAGAIQWQEEGKEFYLNGILYDVVKAKKTNNKTILYCLNDYKEKHLLAKLARVVHAGRSGKSNKGMVKFQFSICIISQNQANVFLPFIDSPQASWVHSELRSSFQEINDPPPWPTLL